MTQADYLAKFWMVIAHIPKGKVATYGDVAAMAVEEIDPLEAVAQQALRPVIDDGDHGRWAFWFRLCSTAWYDEADRRN